MKKGINIWSFHKSMTINECIAMAKEAGYDGIELSLNEIGELNLSSSERDIIEIKKTAEGEGIELPSLASGLYRSYPATSSDEAIRQKSKDIVKKQLETAALLGAKDILVVPGIVAEDGSEREVVQYDIAYDRVLEAFTELKVEAEAHKVNIGLENVWNKFLMSPLEARDLIDKINSQYVGFYLDVGNVINFGFPEHWVRILGKRLKKVHIKDFRRFIGNGGGFVGLLEGDVNFPELMKAFEEVGYDDYITAEMTAHVTNYTIYNTSKSMDIILGR